MGAPGQNGASEIPASIADMVPKPRRRTARTPSRRLSPRQEAFCIEYWKDCNGTAAAIRAGYKSRNADVQAGKLLKDARIIELLNATRERLTEKLHASTEYVLGHVVRSIERSSRGMPVLDGDGNPIMVPNQFGQLAPVMRINERALLRGCEVLGRFLGLGSRLELTGANGAPLVPEESETSMIERARRIAFAMHRGLMVIQGGKAAMPAAVSVLQPAVGDT